MLLESVLWRLRHTVEEVICVSVFVLVFRRRLCCRRVAVDVLWNTAVGFESSGQLSVRAKCPSAPLPFQRASPPSSGCVWVVVGKQKRAYAHYTRAPERQRKKSLMVWVTLPEVVNS